jgi:gluconate kinase
VGGLDQRRLLKHLLIDQQYNPLERPVQNDSKTLPVSINLSLQQIVDFVSEITVNLYFIHC